MNVLGVIGARSGSRGIPDKNIRPLLGKPLFAWIAEAAKQSAYISRLILLTDSPHYARIARDYGVETPVMEPPELATDTVPDFDFLYFATQWLYEHQQWKADIILRLPPTTPLCTPEHIDACVELLINDPNADSARTVTPAGKHPYKLWREQGAYIEPFLPESFTGLRDAHNLPRQTFPKAFQHVDVIALRWNTLMEQRSMAGTHVAFHEIPKTEAVDIDSDVDFVLAELLLKKRLKHNAQHA